MTNTTSDTVQKKAGFIVRWNTPDKDGNPQLRGVKMVAFALLGLILICPLLWLTDLWLDLWNLGSIKIRFFKELPWPVITAVTTAPVLFLLWYWRDDLRRRELVEKRRTNDISDRDITFRIDEAQRDAEEKKSTKVEELRKRMGMDTKGDEKEAGLFDELRSVIIESKNPKELEPLYASISSLVSSNRELENPALALIGSKLADASDNERALLQYYLRDIKHNIRKQREQAAGILNEFASMSHPTENDTAIAKAAIGRLVRINKLDSYFVDQDSGFLRAWLLNYGGKEKEIVRLAEATVDELEAMLNTSPEKPETENEEIVI